jgi:hypothetical protein
VVGKFATVFQANIHMVIGLQIDARSGLEAILRQIAGDMEPAGNGRAAGKLHVGDQSALAVERGAEATVYPITQPAAPCAISRALCVRAA